MSNYSVDRIEGKTAVIEHNGKFFEIELNELPENIKVSSNEITLEDVYLYYCLN